MISATRNRAHSLDVPVRTRYSSSASGGGDSRKSSRNDDNNQMMIGAEDNNSNHTTIGDNKSATEGNDSTLAGNSIWRQSLDLTSNMTNSQRPNSSPFDWIASVSDRVGAFVCRCCESNLPEPESL